MNYDLTQVQNWEHSVEKVACAWPQYEKGHQLVNSVAQLCLTLHLWFKHVKLPCPSSNLGLAQTHVH